jgi:hypothetical protein
MTVAGDPGVGLDGAGSVKLSPGLRVSVTVRLPASVTGGTT